MIKNKVLYFSLLISYLVMLFLIIYPLMVSLGTIKDNAITSSLEVLLLFGYIITAYVIEKIITESIKLIEERDTSDEKTAKFAIMWGLVLINVVYIVKYISYIFGWL